jgi:hypothetical protein
MKYQIAIYRATSKKYKNKIPRKVTGGTMKSRNTTRHFKPIKRNSPAAIQQGLINAIKKYNKGVSFGNNALLKPIPETQVTIIRQITALRNLSLLGDVSKPRSP